MKHHPGGTLMLAYALVILSAFFSCASSHDVMESTVGIFVEYPQYAANPNLPNQAFGSGVVISKDGYIITNHHVVQNAQQIIVQTNEGQREFAQIVGAAPEFDIAVIKIETLPNQSLKPIKFGKSSAVKPGDPVTAIGNAFGFDQTLTTGVISHKDRDVSLSHKVRSYLQVDAAINPGNSGGALLNKDGELIGIVSGIFGRGFNIGIAFAIPIDIADPVIKQVVNKGYVNSGWVGMSTQTLTPELKDAIDAPQYDGVLVSEILPGSPAQRANLQPKDVILSVNDVPINSPAHFASLVTAHGSHSLLSVSYLRDNKVHSTKLKTEQQTRIAGNDLGPWGMNLSEFHHLRLDGVIDTGVQVNQISAQSSGALGGLRPGDVIKSINNQPIKSLDDVARNKLHKNKTNLLEISRQNRTFYVPIR